MDVHFTRVVLSPVLTFVTNSLSSSIKNACKQFYSQDELIKVKVLLWAIGDEDILGPIIKRRDSMKHNETDKVGEDLVNGSAKLNTVNMLPIFAVDSAELARMPKAHLNETLP